VPFSTVNRALLYLTRSGAGNPIGRPPTYDLRMTLLSRLPAALLIALALAGSFALRGSHAAVSSTLEAFVNDQGNIGINYADGTPVGKAIPPGTYTVHVDDSTSFHNFHLYGPGFDNSTDVGLVQKATWTVTFQTGGVYTFICDLHPDSMLGQVTATNDAASVSGGSGGNGSSAAPSTSGGVQSNTGTKTASTTTAAAKAKAAAAAKAKAAKAKARARAKAKAKAKAKS
jgi:plastocyanin